MSLDKVKISRSMLVMLGLVALLIVTGGCSLRIYDDPMAFEPRVDDEYRDPNAPPSRNHARTYTMKQKLFSFRDQYVIKDEFNVPVYFVKEKNFTIGNKFSFRDQNGVELAYISERVLSLLPKYKILRDGMEIATISKKFRLGNTAFKIKIPGETDIQVKGNFWDYDYIFIRNGIVVAEVSKKPFSWTDTYFIKVANRENDVLVLATAAIIDMVCHSPEDYHEAML